jgi:hypothetical protein
MLAKGNGIKSDLLANFMLIKCNAPHSKSFQTMMNKLKEENINFFSLDSRPRNKK